MLDIMLSNQRHTISNVTTIPGMSDNKALSFTILTNLDKHKLKSRKIYQFHKAVKNPS